MKICTLILLELTVLSCCFLCTSFSHCHPFCIHNVICFAFTSLDCLTLCQNLISYVPHAVFRVGCFFCPLRCLVSLESAVLGQHGSFLDVPVLTQWLRQRFLQLGICPDICHSPRESSVQRTPCLIAAPLCNHCCCVRNAVSEEYRRHNLAFRRPRWVKVCWILSLSGIVRASQLSGMRPDIRNRCRIYCCCCQNAWCVFYDGGGVYGGD